MAHQIDPQRAALVAALREEQRRQGWNIPELALELGLSYYTTYFIVTDRRQPGGRTLSLIIRRFPHLLGFLLADDRPSNGHSEHVGSGPDPPPGRP